MRKELHHVCTVVNLIHVYLWRRVKTTAVSSHEESDMILPVCSLICPSASNQLEMPSSHSPTPSFLFSQGLASLECLAPPRKYGGQKLYAHPFRMWSFCWRPGDSLTYSGPRSSVEESQAPSSPAAVTLLCLAGTM